MRDDSYLQTESEVAAAPSAWRSRAVTAGGALISLAILAVVVVWSYRLGVRDANDVPVIRAQTEATKIKPDEPGGLEVAHQGREIYNVVNQTPAAGETTYAPAEEALTTEDVAAVAPAPEPRPAPAAPAPVEDTATPQPDPVEETPVVEAPAPVPEETAAAPVEETEPEAPAEDVSALAPRQAPVAQSRPVRTAAAPARAAEQAEPRAAALASRIQIQLGAFNTEAIAGEQWTALKTRNGDLLSGRGRVVTPVVSGGRRLYRLRAGPFESVDEASNLCRALKSRGEDCIVARAR